MRVGEAGSSAPLQHLLAVRSQDGPPLPVGEQLRLLSQLQVLHAVLGLRVVLLSVYYVHLAAFFHQVLEGKKTIEIFKYFANLSQVTLSLFRTLKENRKSASRSMGINCFEMIMLEIFN